MDFLFREFTVNINSFGSFNGIIMLFLFIAIFIIVSIFIQKIPVVNYTILIEVFSLLYLFVFLLLANAKSPESVFNYTRLLYSVFLLLTIVIILSVTLMTNNTSFVPLSISIIFSSFLVFAIYVNDEWIITRNYIVGSYVSGGKGQFYFLIITYMLLLNIYLFIDFVLLYVSKKPVLKDIWSLYLCILFMTVYFNVIYIVMLFNKYTKPPVYVNTILFGVVLSTYAFKKIGQSIKERESLYFSYLYDEATRVYTRSYILDTISTVLGKSYLNNYYVALIDIDDFKIINDVYGHHVGDIILSELGMVLVQNSNANVVCGRLGGDEFIVLFRNVSKEQVQKTLDVIRRDFIFKLTEHQIDLIHTKTGLSIGVINIHEFMTIKDVLTYSDNAMYDAKKSGKNTIIYRNIDHVDSSI